MSGFRKFPVIDGEDKNMTQKIDRRTMLATTAIGGGALAGLLVVADAAAQTPVPVGRMRRVVTGHNAEGKSYIVSDEVAEMGNLWATKPDLPLGQVPAGEAKKLTHATGEGRFYVAALPPSRDPKPTRENRGGFHQTPGIAYCYILSGEIVFMTDTQETTVRAGDLVVERNTFHSWRNEGTTPVAMLIVVVNAV
jgi:mannose-6-phosphate isomerase-like protein (cupin superfamily)